MEFFSPTQITYFTDAQVYGLTLAQLAYLNTSQIQAFTNHQFSELKLDQIDNFSADQVSVFTNSQLQSLGTNFRILNENVGFLTENQIQNVTLSVFSPSLFQYLDPEQIPYFNNVSGFSKDQFQALSYDQFASLDPTLQIPFINTSWMTEEQIQSMSNDQVAAFTTTQIQAFEPWQLQFIDPLQLSIGTLGTDLTINQYVGLTSEQINSMLQLSLPSDKVTALQNIQALPPLSDSDVANLTQAQIQILVLVQIQSISTNAMALLTSQQVSYFTPNQIAYFTYDQIIRLNVSYLSSSQISYLNADQLYALSNQQIQTIATAYPTAMTLYQFNIIDPTSYQYFNASQLSFDKQLYTFMNCPDQATFQTYNIGAYLPEIIPFIPLKFIPYLTRLQIQSLTQAQIQEFTISQIASFTYAQYTGDVTTPNQPSMFTSAQVNYFQQWQSTIDTYVFFTILNSLYP